MPGILIPAQPAIGAGGRVIAAPFQFVTNDDESLFVRSACSVAGVTVAVQGRRYDQDGQIIPFRFVHEPNSDRSIKSDVFAFGKGAVLNLSALALVGTLAPGQCYLLVQLLKGSVGAGTLVGTLLAGYVSQRGSLGYPGSVLVDTLEGAGTLRLVSGTTPAAGAQVSETVPTFARWELLDFSVAFNSDATAINRFVALNIQRSGSLIGSIQHVTAHGQNTLRSYSWFPGLPYVVDTDFGGLGRKTMGLPHPLWLSGGDSVVVTATGLQAGDTFASVRYAVREWIET